MESSTNEVYVDLQGCSQEHSRYTRRVVVRRSSLTSIYVRSTSYICVQLLACCRIYPTRSARLYSVSIPQSRITRKHVQIREARHHSGVTSTVKQAGHPLDKKVAFGIWEWGVR
jgi:sensor c-di-GMP phosphodiesterase-like protein